MVTIGLAMPEKLEAMKELTWHLGNVDISRQCEKNSRTTSPFFAPRTGERATLVACTDGWTDAKPSPKC